MTVVIEAGWIPALISALIAAVATGLTAFAVTWATMRHDRNQLKVARNLDEESQGRSLARTALADLAYKQFAFHDLIGRFEGAETPNAVALLIQLPDLAAEAQNPAALSDHRLVSALSTDEVFLVAQYRNTLARLTTLGIIMERYVPDSPPELPSKVSEEIVKGVIGRLADCMEYGEKLAYALVNHSGWTHSESPFPTRHELGVEVADP